MDILDTSIVRGLRRQDINALRSERRLAVSPFTLWELLCHLDEIHEHEDADTAFRRRRGQVAILASIDILHDPLAEHAIEIGAHHLANPTRLEDRDVAQTIVSEIISADSIDDLSRRRFRYPDGTLATFHDLANNARNALHEEEQRFISDVRRIWHNLSDETGHANPARLSDDDIWSWARSLVTALMRSYLDDGVEDDDLFIKVCSTMYLYFGYILCRIHTYSFDENGELGVPANDAEDGFICMHMRLFEPYTLVVGDRRTERAIQRAIAIWNRNVSEVPAKCNVMNRDEYRALARHVRTREIAYFEWLGRGCPEGDDWAHWFDAEHTVDD